MAGTILVTGASGRLGGQIARLLAERGARLRLLVRDAKRAPRDVDAEICVGDYADSHAMERAFAGLETAFLVSVTEAPGKRAELHARAFGAAAAAGVRHVVYLSLQGSAADSRYPFARDHFRSEESLRATKVAHTILRNGKYSEQLFEPELLDAPAGLLRGADGRARVAWIARRDSARVIASILERPPGGVVTYTGPEALTLEETAARISHALARPLPFATESATAARLRVLALSRARGIPEWRAELAAGTSEAIAAGEYATVHDASAWGGALERLEQTLTRPEFRRSLEAALTREPAVPSGFR